MAETNEDIVNEIQAGFEVGFENSNKEGVMINYTEVVKTELEKFLTSTYDDATQVKVVVQKYMEKVAPILENAIAEGDEKAIKYLYAGLIAAAGRASLGVIYKNARTISAFIVGLVRVIVLKV